MRKRIWVSSSTKKSEPLIVLLSDELLFQAKAFWRIAKIQNAFRKGARRMGQYPSRFKKEYFI